MKNNKVIISDPNDEVNHIYEDLNDYPKVGIPKKDDLITSPGSLDQQEGNSVNPSYMNNYG